MSKKHSILAAALLSLLATTFLSACDDDDVKATPLSRPVATAADATYNSLTFRWDKIDGATQYGYRLKGESGAALVTDVTNTNTVTFSGLEYDTPYSLEVWAYGAYGSKNATSEVTVLQARTADLTDLAVPQLAAAAQGASVAVTWQEIEHAASYSILITDTEGAEVRTAQVSEPAYTVSGIAAGTYTVTVTATPDSPAFRASTASLTIVVERSAQWTVEGTYTTGDGRSWTARMSFFGDGEYVIEDWYGVAGYNFTFFINESTPDDMFVCSDEYEVDSNYWVQVPTGKSDPSIVYIYPWYNYCSFTGDRSAGEIKLYTSDTMTTEKYDTFTWGGQGGPNIEDLCGEWTMHSTGYEGMTSNDWVLFEINSPIVITKVSDTQISVPGWFLEDEAVVGTVDFANRTVTFEPQTYATYYIFAGATADTPVTGTISEDYKTITVPTFGAWYNNYNWFYEPSATIVR